MPKDVLEAMIKIQQHCEVRDVCDGCCFWSTNAEPGHNSCVLSQTPELWVKPE